MKKTTNKPCGLRLICGCTKIHTVLPWICDFQSVLELKGAYKTTGLRNLEKDRKRKHRHFSTLRVSMYVEILLCTATAYRHTHTHPVTLNHCWCEIILAENTEESLKHKFNNKAVNNCIVHRPKLHRKRARIAQGNRRRIVSEIYIHFYSCYRSFVSFLFLQLPFNGFSSFHHNWIIGNLFDVLVHNAQRAYVDYAKT